MTQRTRSAVADAEHSALRIEHDRALRALEPVLADPEDAEFVGAVHIAAAIHAHRGVLARAAELYGLVAPEDLPHGAAHGAVTLIGVGDRAGASDLLATSMGAPTALATGWRLAAQGLQQSIDGGGVAALATLMQAVATVAPVASNCVMPDSPAALTALVALHQGELDVAESVLNRAVSVDLGGPPMRIRHQTLLAWVAMARGNLAEATAILDTIGDLSVDDLRDAYFVQAIRVGVSRRRSDPALLADTWTRARTVVAGLSMDLFHLLPLGELLAGAARLEDEAWLRPQVEAALALLERLGNPALWSATFHWYGVQAAIASEQPAALLPHADAIGEAAQISQHAQTLANAGRTWIRVLRRDVDVDDVRSAVEALTRIGLAWDASRLAAQAALYSNDRRVTLDLLNMARAAHGPDTSKRLTSPAASRSSHLTDREWEIARLVVQGIGYKEIGSRLYISPKTVEHHVASVRRRLGAPSRAEMIDMLRRLLATSGAE